MKSNAIISLLAIILITCSACNQKKEQTKEVVETHQESTENDLIDDNGDPIIIGKQERITLESDPYKKWFDISYKEHTLDTTTINEIKGDLAQTAITVFMGTWCEDSQREVPAFFKALDLAGIDASTINLITISEDKESPEDLLEGRDVEYVPTIIFEQEGKELGRIVEYSIFSIEKDMEKILKGEDYKHPYAE